VREAEFDREIEKMVHLPARDQEKILRIASSMVRSLLKTPIEALKDEPDASRRLDRAEAARHLFGLDRTHPD
jgi:glutamyl-tRNA reductase